MVVMVKSDQFPIQH